MKPQERASNITTTTRPLNTTMDFSLLNTTIVALLSLILFCFFLFRNFSKTSTKEAPTVSGAWPILGHLPLLTGSQTAHKTLGSLADKYGPIFTIKLGSTTRALVLSNWEMAKECFTTNDVVASSRPKPIAVEIMSYNQAFIGWAPYGPYWRQLRKTVTLEFLSHRRIELLSITRVSEVRTSIKELYDVWSHQNNNNNNRSVSTVVREGYPNSTNNNNKNDYVSVEMKQWFAQLTLNMVLRMVVGKRYFGCVGVTDDDEDKKQKCLENIREFMRLIGTSTVGDVVPYLKWVDFGGYQKEMKKTAKEFDKMLSEWLEEHKRKRSDGKERDFMDGMISVLNDRPIEGFDADTIIKATTLELILGGSDTTATTLTWAMCLLLRNPLVLEKAREEIDMQIGKERCVNESDISKLVYLQAIVKETLRLYPPAPFSSPREFNEDCTIGGYHVKKGTRLIPNLWKIQRDPSVWSDPTEFQPERFLTTHKEVDVKGQNFELLPFGSGRRMCAGMSLGLNMVHFTLANFLHSFETLSASSQSIDVTEIFGFVNTKATPLEILVKPRLSPDYYVAI